MGLCQTQARFVNALNSEWDPIKINKCTFLLLCSREQREAPTVFFIFLRNSRCWIYASNRCIEKVLSEYESRTLASLFQGLHSSEFTYLPHYHASVDIPPFLCNLRLPCSRDTVSMRSSFDAAKVPNSLRELTEVKALYLWWHACL